MATRLYFHAATDSTSGLPTAEQSSRTSDKNAEAQTINHAMNTTIGTAQVGLTMALLADTSLHTYYYARFVSPPFGSSQTSVSANTWTYSFAHTENNASANFPVNGTNKAVPVNCYVWRPSSQTKIGTMLDGDTASTVDEGTTQRASTVTFSGSAVSSTQAEDVICFEVWFEVTQGIATARTGTFYYDGTTVTTTDGSSSNHASFIETPENLALAIPITMTQVGAKAFANRFVTKV